jgi:Flp pilus assembly protein TadD
MSRLVPTRIPPPKGSARRTRYRHPAAGFLAALLAGVIMTAAADPSAQLRQALDWLAGGETDRAERSIEQIVERHPDYWPAALELGRLRVRQRRVADAVPVLERAALVAPNEYDLRSLLAQAYALSERLAEAEREFLAALALKPGDFQCHYNLGRLYRLQERYEEANEHLVQALDVVPSPRELPRVQQNLAMSLLALRRRSEALPHLEAFLRARPERNDLRMELASAQFNLSMYDESLVSVDRALADGFQEPIAHYLRGMLCKIKGRNDEAVKSFRACLEGSPANTRARYELATILFEEQRYEETEPQLRQVLEAEPEHPNAHYLLSTLLRRLGRDTEAEAELAIHNRIAEQQRARGRTTAGGPE